MIGLDWPWMLALLPFPWLLRVLLPPARPAPEGAVRVPFFEEVRALQSTAGRVTGRRSLTGLLAALAWLALVVAAAKPQHVGEPVHTPISGRDLVLAVDISGSMDQTDFDLDGRQASRLDVVKRVAGEFIERREGDRLGLILFGARAYVQTPLTFDRPTVVAMLEEAEIGLAGKLTAIGDAIGLAVKRMRDAESRERVMILLTDGANTTGRVPPRRAALLAARESLRIYTIGIGSEQRFNSLFGVQELRASADLDEPGLTRIAEITGGRYFRAADTGALERIYAELDELEPIDVDDEVFRPTRSLFHWPLGAALALSTWLALRSIRWRPAPAVEGPAA